MPVPQNSQQDIPEACSSCACWPCLQLVTQEQIEAARTGLSAKAAGNAEAAFEAEKARVGEARRAELEAQLAAAAQAAATAAAEAEVGSRGRDCFLQLPATAGLPPQSCIAGAAVGASCAIPTGVCQLTFNRT